MATEQETAYSAGLFDGEGSIHIGERTAATLDGVGRMKGPQQILALKRSLAEMGRDSFTVICGQLVPWEGYVTLGGERIWIRIDHGQIVAAEAPPDAGRPNVNRKWIAGRGMVGLEAGAVLRAARD